MNCAFCRQPLQVQEPLSKKDTCPHCNRDLRCCKQCKFYDQNAYNECREVRAERIIDKARANHCDYFLIRGSKGGGGAVNRAKEARRALEALFKKK